MKRVFDFSLALFGLIFLFPLLLVIGILIKLNDKGPVLFKQKRVGKFGKKFFLYKFRSMSLNECSKEGSFEPGNTSRVTPFGVILRRTKFDEIPQLINVLKGEMSMVGPRPEVEKWVAIYPEKWKLIHLIPPGITDNASIEFRNEESLLAESSDPETTYKEIILPRKLDLYNQYITNHTFYGDLQIIIKSIYSVLFRSNFK